MIIGLHHYLIVAAILFTIGVFGIFVNRKNVIIILMCVELILLAVNINFVAFSTHMEHVPGADPIAGQIFALFILTVAGPCGNAIWPAVPQRDGVQSRHNRPFVPVSYFIMGRLYTNWFWRRAR